jgi:predicted dithiol-disulfide oxidoreductase (DUF899 family)
MAKHAVVSEEKWLAARREHLAAEKEFTRARDRLSEARRALPWVKVGKAYSFRGPKGTQSLANLFEGRSQLIVYHFMFAPEWNEGCKSCSFWMDNFDGIISHLNQRDVRFVAVSRAPLEKLEAFKQRMGWQFKWVSSLDSDFNYDYRVSFTETEKAAGEVQYNYGRRKFFSSEGPGISVFRKDDDGTIYHTYSCYARGLDILNGAYNLLDLVSKGRDEETQPYTMAWVRLRDKYDPQAR